MPKLPPPNGAPYVLFFAVDSTLERAFQSACASPVCVTPEAQGAERILSVANPVAAVLLCVEDGRDEAIEIARLAHARWPRTPTVLFTRRPVNGSLERLAAELLAESVSGDGDTERLVETLATRAVDAVSLREAQLALALVAAARLRLTRRQSDVLRLLCLGVPRKELAERLGVSCSAVDQQLRKIFGRFGESDTTGLMQRLTSLVLEESLQGARWLRRLSR